MTRLVPAIALVVSALGFAGTGAATPGNGTNAVYVFNNCDSGIGQVTLISEGKGAFATAHVVGSNRPAPLISLDYEVVIDGVGVVDTGGFRHSHPQEGRPIVSCTGHFDIPGGVVNIEVTGFFPAGP